MIDYIKYSNTTGRIIQKGRCPNRDFSKQIFFPNEKIIAVPDFEEVDDIFTKVNINTGKIISSTTEERLLWYPKISEEDSQANITNKELQDLKNRVTELENS